MSEQHLVKMGDTFTIEGHNAKVTRITRAGVVILELVNSQAKPIRFTSAEIERAFNIEKAIG